jgi:hypothetical protein
VVFPAPLMSTIQELGAFLAREAAAVTTPPRSTAPAAAPAGIDQGANGAPAAARD